MMTTASTTTPPSSSMKSLTCSGLLLLAFLSSQASAFQTPIGSGIGCIGPALHHPQQLPLLRNNHNDNDSRVYRLKSRWTIQNMASGDEGEKDTTIATATTTPKATDPSSSTNVKFFELDEAFEDDGENVVGTKFFGGNAIKDELYVPEEEERAVELQKVRALEYNRFEDKGAFGDELGKRVGEALQFALNGILYDDDGDDSQSSNGGVASWKEDSSLKWTTPFDKAGSASPLKELKGAKSFYNQLDVAILSGNTVKSDGKFSTVEIRWDIGAVWPNPWESRVLLTGTSVLTVADDKENNVITVVKQEDRLDGSNPNDVVSSLSSQLSPRFWDVYHIGMTPSSELDPRFDPATLAASSSSTKLSKLSKKGLLSKYKLSYLPPRLVTQPSLLDINGRAGRTAQALPNHGFTTAIKTMGPNKQTFVPVTPIEVSISKASVGEEDGSLIKWTVPVPPEFASNAVLPLPLIEDEDGDDEEEVSTTESLTTQSKKTFEPSPYSPRRPSTLPPPKPSTSLQCNYSLRPGRLVATLPYAGNPQDEAVTDLRRKLYQEVVERDGFKPKLDPETKRPMFFFWMNDAKACFTRKGGLGMAVYEWRAEWSQSNEVGIELEL